MATTDQYINERPFHQDADVGLHYYLDLLKRRFLYFAIPFILVLAGGVTVVMMLPAIYSSQAKILVESQQIPSDLVRSTVTTSANERIQIIEQRILSRDTLLTISQKLNVFEDRRNRLSSTDLVDLMRQRTEIRPFEVVQRGNRHGRVTIAFTIAFEHERPATAMKVANEYLTLVLSEDVRTRTSQATETARFLAKEVERLELDLAKTQAEIATIRRMSSEAVPQEDVEKGLALLRAELLQKSSVYSESHPEVQALRQQIATLEQQVSGAKPTPSSTAAASPTTDITAGPRNLAQEKIAIEERLQAAKSKLWAARLGEKLEQDQQSERFEVLEQPTLPTNPVKPNRKKMLALAFGLAAMAGIGAVFAVEAFDKTIRGGADLAGVINSKALVSIPYITTSAEARRHRRMVLLSIVLVLALLAGGAAAVHFLYMPLELVAEKIMMRLPL